jgi:hypothetical protein
MQLLRQQVDDVEIRPDLTVADLADKIDSEDQLGKTLSKAQRIGGPRWLDDQTCQVRLEISGTAVAETLTQLVADNESKSPISSQALAPRLKELTKATFNATGNSTGSKALGGVRPIREADGWAGVDDQARQQAVAAAKRDAIARVIDSVRAVPLAQGKTVGDAISVKPVHDAVEQWLAARPVTRLEFQQDFQVKLTLAAPPEDLYNTFASAVKAQKQVPQPKDEKEWESLRARFTSKVHRVVGRAAATAPAKVVRAVQLPENPPAWVHQQLDAEGSSQAKKVKLKAARAAEGDAVNRLRSQVDALPITNNLTLGEAQKRDKRLAEAVDRALKDARLYKVDYESDGSARVKVILDLREVWEEIQAVP